MLCCAIKSHSKEFFVSIFEALIMNHYLKMPYNFSKLVFLIFVISMVLQSVLSGQSNQEVVQIVIESLKGDDPAMRTSAITLLREIPGPEVTRALTEELPKLPAVAQVQLLVALADRGDKAALPAVVQAIKAGEASVRIAALKAVGQLGDASSVLMLAQVAANGTSDEQIAARESLYRLRGPDIDEAILTDVRSAEPEIKVELIRSVAQRHIVAGTQTLLKIAQYQDQKVQRESFKALKVIADPNDLPALVELLINLPSESVRGEAERTVAAVAHKIRDRNHQAEVVLERLSSAEGVKPRCSLLSVLGRIGDNSALPVLRTALNSDNEKVQDAAVRALSDWPSPEPIEDLLQIAQTSNNDVHRVLALRGFVRLLGIDSDRTAEEVVQMYRKAMSLAPNEIEKKRVLSGLANAGSLEALQMAAQYLDDRALCLEAQLSVVKIAERIYRRFGQQIKQVLQKVIHSTESDTLRQQAQEIVNKIEE
jgi:HEAT repeat protein